MSRKNNASWCKKYRLKKIENKICVDCTDKAVQGKIRCQHHLDKQAENAKKRRLSLNKS